MSQPLFEQYRPQTFGEVVGQDKALARLEVCRQRGGLAGEAYFITGSSGTGKTTIARLIAAETAQPWSTMELDASQLDADTVRDIQERTKGQPLGGGAWCII